MKAVEGADIWDQTRLLFFEHLPDRLAWNVGVFVCLRIHQAPICQPGIQLCKGFEPRARHEEASAQHANLVLYLPLLPARGRATGNGVNQIMTAHLLKAAVVSPTLPDEDRVHRRLHIVVDPARTSAAKERKRLVVRIEHHLLGLAGIRAHIRHSAEAEANMSDFDSHCHTVQNHDLMAPVELVSFARIKAQGNKRARRCCLRSL